MALPLLMGCAPTADSGPGGSAGPDGEDVCWDCCNGSPDLCDRSLEDITLLRTHNSHASAERGYHELSRNHMVAIPTQLADGARSLNVDIYEVGGELVACHGFCELGQQPFDEILDEVGDFLDAHPTEVVVMDFQDEAPTGAIQGALAASGLGDLALARAGGTSWPSLGQMIADNTRLVTLGNRQSGDPDWFLSHSEHVFGTGWQYDTPEDLDCATSPFEHGLYEVTHVLTNPLASPDNAALINGDLAEHVARCEAELGIPVNMVSVDYYQTGDTVGQVWALNGLD